MAPNSHILYTYPISTTSLFDLHSNPPTFPHAMPEAIRSGKYKYSRCKSSSRKFRRVHLASTKIDYFAAYYAYLYMRIQVCDICLSISRKGFPLLVSHWVGRELPQCWQDSRISGAGDIESFLYAG